MRERGIRSCDSAPRLFAWCTLEKIRRWISNAPFGRSSTGRAGLGPGDMTLTTRDPSPAKTDDPYRPFQAL